MSTPFVKRIAATTDDGCNIGGSDWNYGYIPMFGNYDDLGTLLTAGIRFTGVTVPYGATVTSAYLAYVSASTDSSAVIAKIAGIAEDNTASMSSDPTGRTKTSNKVDWDVTNHVHGTTYTSPDIKLIVQEIIDRAGWSSGNAMGFLIYDDGSGNYCNGYPHDYEGSPTEAFQLTINYIVSSFSPSKSPSKSPSVSPSMSPSPGVSFSPSFSPSISPSQSPSVSVSPSVSKSPSLSPSVSPSVSISPSLSPSVSPSVSISPSVSPGPGSDYGLKIKKPSVNKNVESIDDPKELVFTSALGVLGLRLLDTVTAQTNASGNIDTTDNHSIGYPPITIVTTTAYDGNKVNFPVEWHSIYLNKAKETIEVTETFNFKVTGTSIEIIVHAEQYNHDTFVTSNISGRSYTFNIHYYFNELVET